ncbi:MFS transporter [Candidatus Hydrogenedentota bacterium]
MSKSENHLSDQTIPVGQRLAYSVFSFGNLMPQTIARIGVLVYLTQYIGLDPLVLGLLAIIPTLWDAVSDPLMGMISDRTRSRWGRRRPYILVGGMSWVFALGIGWIIPPLYVPWAEANNVSMTYLYAFILFSNFLTRTCHTVSHVPYQALGGEMSYVPFERTRLAAWRSMAGLLSKIISLLVGKRLVQSFGISSYPYIIICLLVTAVLGTLATFFFCKEKRQVASKKKNPTFRDMVRLFKFRPFLVFTAAFIGSNVGFMISSGLIVFIGRIWFLDDGAIFTFEIFAFVMTFLGFSFWTRFAKRYGNVNTLITVLCGLAIVFPSSRLFFRPYNGEPLFTGQAIKNTAKRFVYKFLTLDPFYSGIDVANLEQLKADARSNEIVGSFFTDVDPDSTSDEDFISHLNNFISVPDLYEQIKDRPYFSPESFKDYGAFAEISAKENSVISLLLGEAAPAEISPETLGMLDERLKSLSFYENFVEAQDLLEFPLDAGEKDGKSAVLKTLRKARKTAAKARVKIVASRYPEDFGNGLNLEEAEFSVEQMLELAEAIDKEADCKRWLDGEMPLDKFMSFVGMGRNEGKLKQKTHEWLIEELSKASRVEVDSTIMKAFKGLFGKSPADPTISLTLTGEEMESMAFLNRAMLEAVYPDLLEKSIHLNIAKASNKLAMMLVKTRNFRDKPFGELNEEQQKNIRTLNRQLMMHIGSLKAETKSGGDGDDAEAGAVKRFLLKIVAAFQTQTSPARYPLGKIHDSVPGIGLFFLCLFGAIAGFLNAGLVLMPGAMLPDIADADELNTGFSRMGTLFGVESFSMKMEHAVMPLIKGFVLVAIGLRHKLDMSMTPEQLDSIVTSLRWTYALPVIFSCGFGALILFFFYPLNSERLAEIRAELEIQRRELARESELDKISPSEG